MDLISRGILVFLVGVSLMGCASVQSTSEYYIPNTTKVYPPKPKDAPIPILGEFPKEPYEIIGRLSFPSFRNFGFLRRSMEYNARKAGADAVVLRGVKSQVLNGAYYVPPTVEYVPVVNYYNNNNCGKKGNRSGSYVTTYPYFRPGYTVPYQNVMTTIDAQMILFKNSRR
ncbi:MAG: hypothetical protein ABI615_09055 [Chthoniobacterales bacterium]